MTTFVYESEVGGVNDVVLLLIQVTVAQGPNTLEGRPDFSSRNTPAYIYENRKTPEMQPSSVYWTE